MTAAETRAGRGFEATLWQVLGGTRGGPNRRRIVLALHERPQNANELATALGLDYKTVRHHLDVLEEKHLVHSSGDEYGAVYRPTTRLHHYWETVEEIGERVTAV